MAARKSKKMSPASKHEDREDYEATLAVVAHYYNRGYSLYKIKDKIYEERGVQVSHVTVSKYIDELVARWREASRWEREVYVTQMLDQINDVMVEAWEAYEQSKEDDESRTQEMTVPLRLKDAASKLNSGRDGNRPMNPAEGELMLARETIRRSGRLPAAQYLTIVMQCWQAKRELLGLDAPKETAEDKAHKGKVLMDWSARAKSLPPVEDVEQEILRVKGALPQKEAK